MKAEWGQGGGKLEQGLRCIPWRPTHLPRMSHTLGTVSVAAKAAQTWSVVQYQWGNTESPTISTVLAINTVKRISMGVLYRETKIRYCWVVFEVYKAALLFLTRLGNAEFKPLLLINVLINPTGTLCKPSHVCFHICRTKHVQQTWRLTLVTSERFLLSFHCWHAASIPAGVTVQTTG